MSAPYQEPSPPGATPLRRWVARMGGAHPDEVPPGEREAPPPRPQWRWTVVNGAWWAGVVGLSISGWVAFATIALTAVAATGEHWAWDRAGPEGPGWRPLNVAFWVTTAVAAVAGQALTDEGFLVGIAFTGPFATAVDQIGRGIRAEREGLPRPASDAPPDESA